MSGDDLYRRLQQALDQMPVGFPATESGVEIRILQQLFTPRQAKVALALGIIPEPVPVIHGRLQGEMSVDCLSEILEGMEHRGLIRSEGRRVPRYARLPFVIGVYEGQVDRLTPELARDLIEYFDQALGQAVRPKKTPQLRTVPINQKIVPERGVARYDDIRETVRNSAGPFAVMNCICRQAADLAGHPCRRTDVRENCLTMGPAASVMMEHGQARAISREAMLDLLDVADREGLVLQPQNTRNPMFVCCCCGCCCVALKAGNKAPVPVEFFSAEYTAWVDAEKCQVCGECVERCQMKAVEVDAAAVVTERRCIGCGLCVSTCPSGAMMLRAKAGTPEPPPNDTAALYMKIYRERFGTAALVKTAVEAVVRRWV